MKECCRETAAVILEQVAKGLARVDPPAARTIRDIIAEPGLIDRVFEDAE